LDKWIPIFSNGNRKETRWKVEQYETMNEGQGAPKMKRRAPYPKHLKIEPNYKY
jgi:hypothetical protein